MHVNGRQRLVLELLEPRGSISFHNLERLVEASPVQVRCDLGRMAQRAASRRTGRSDFDPAAALICSICTIDPGGFRDERH